jgi:uroporphyrinogen-III synthase
MDRATGPAVVLTRQHEDNQELAAALTARGVVVREIPCLATRYLSFQQPITNNLDAFVFTSRHGVRGFFQQKTTFLSPSPISGEGGAERRVRGEGINDSDQRVLVAAVGRATAKEIQSCGLAVDLIADPPEGAVLANLLKKALPVGSRLLMVRGNLRASEIDTILRKAGYQLDELVVYENVDVPIATLQPFPVAAVFIASPSAAKRLLTANPWMRDRRLFAIGRTTAQALKKLGAVTIEEIGADPFQWIEVLFGAYQAAANPVE